MSKGNSRRRSSVKSSSISKKGGINWTTVLIFGTIGILGVVLIMNVARQLTPIAGAQTFGTIAGGQHVGTPVDYPQDPPVGGAHYNSWQNCGIYYNPVTNENAVHSLEHGAVWVAYHPDLPADQVETLRNYARGRSYMLVSPYPGLDANVALSAWSAQLKVDDVNDTRISQFIAKYRQGSQVPEPGALCVQGIGTPDE